jgi:hypothetical protein
LREQNPKLFLWKNVPRLAKFDKADVFKDFLEILDKIGKVYQAVSTFRHGFSWLLCGFKNIWQLVKLSKIIQIAKVAKLNQSQPDYENV